LAQVGFDTTAQYLVNAEWLLPTAQKLRPYVGGRPSGLSEVLPHLHTDQGGKLASGGRRVAQYGDQILAH
jgi:hypothetical protein